MEHLKIGTKPAVQGRKLQHDQKEFLHRLEWHLGYFIAPGSDLELLALSYDALNYSPQLAAETIRNIPKDIIVDGAIKL